VTIVYIATKTSFARSSNFYRHLIAEKSYDNFYTNLDTSEAYAADFMSMSP
jgi:hypothetical protein